MNTDEQLADAWDLIRPPAWKQRANCKGTSTKVFFSSVPEDVDTVKKLCVSCPVKGPCALLGVWQRGGRYAGLGSKTLRSIRLKDPARWQKMTGETPEEAGESRVRRWETGSGHNGRRT